MTIEALLAAILITCPGTSWRFCDGHPAAYSAAVAHHGNIDAEDRPDAPAAVAERPETPSEPDAPETPECRSR